MENLISSLKTFISEQLSTVTTYYSYLQSICTTNTSTMISSSTATSTMAPTTTGKMTSSVASTTGPATITGEATTSGGITSRYT